MVVIISILSLHNSRRFWGNEKNGLSALFYGNVRVRTIFFYYLDIIRAALHSSTRSRELSSVLQLSLIIIYLDKHRVSVRRSEERKRENHHLLSLNGLSIRDENTSIIVEKTSATPAFWKYFPKFVCVLRWFSPAPSCDLTKRDTLKSCLYRGGRHALHRMRTLMSPMCPSGVRTDQDYLLSLSLQWSLWSPVSQSRYIFSEPPSLTGARPRLTARLRPGLIITRLRSPETPGSRDRHTSHTSKRILFWLIGSLWSKFLFEKDIKQYNL